jgi:hypothetical protein
LVSVIQEKISRPSSHSRRLIHPPNRPHPVILHLAAHQYAASLPSPHPLVESRDVRQS